MALFSQPVKQIDVLTGNVRQQLRSSVSPPSALQSGILEEVLCWAEGRPRCMALAEASQDHRTRSRWLLCQSSAGDLGGTPPGGKATLGKGLSIVSM